MSETTTKLVEIRVDIPGATCCQGDEAELRIDAVKKTFDSRRHHCFIRLWHTGSVPPSTSRTLRCDHRHHLTNGAIEIIVDEHVIGERFAERLFELGFSKASEDLVIGIASTA